MGNPAVWWGAFCTVIALIVLRLRKGRLGGAFFVSVAALSQFLPWVLIPRETYIYHYFATVPFLILLMGVLAKYLIERTRHGKSGVYFPWCVLVAVCDVLSCHDGNSHFKGIFGSFPALASKLAVLLKEGAVVRKAVSKIQKRSFAFC